LILGHIEIHRDEEDSLIDEYLEDDSSSVVAQSQLACSVVCPSV